MEWPEELLKLLEDPILANVRIKVPIPSANDRMAGKLEEITVWVEQHGRLPQRTGNTLKEKQLAVSLNALRSQADQGSLRMYDRLHLLQS